MTLPEVPDPQHWDQEIPVSGGTEDIFNILHTHFPDARARLEEVRALCVLAFGCGWVRTADRRGIMVVAHDGTRIVLPKDTHIKAGVFRQNVNKIMRHRSPQRDHTSLATAPLGLLVNEIIAALRLGPDHERVLREAAATATEQQAVWKAECAQRADEYNDRFLPVAQPEPEPEPAVTDENELIAAFDTKVSSESESEAARHTVPGMVYSKAYSSTVTQRGWSDGTVDYACPVCGVTNSNPRSIASHHASHTMAKKRGESESDDVLEEIAALIDLRTGRSERMQADNLALLHRLAEAEGRAEAAEAALTRLRESLGAAADILLGLKED